MMSETSAEIKNEKLERMRRVATGILLLMVVLYVLSRSYQESFPVLEWLRAFAEAGMVGGLADWFAVTALFRHPLGLKIPHTAIIPREKDRIGRSFAQFIHGNFLTAEPICKQVRELKLVPRLAQWMAQPEKAERLSQQTVKMLPSALGAMEKYKAHHFITEKLFSQLKKAKPHDIVVKLLDWLMSEERFREVLAPLLAQFAKALSANKESIDEVARNHAPLKKIPLLGKLSKALVEGMSGRATGSFEEQLVAASESVEDPLWEVIGEQLIALKVHLQTSDELQGQLVKIRDLWLNDEKSEEFAHSLWQQISDSLHDDLAKDKPRTTHHLAEMLMSLGRAVEGDDVLAGKLEYVLLEALDDVLTKHGDYLQTMIRSTIEQWDADTLMLKLEAQVGPDLQFIRINGTLIGGLVGLALHGLGVLIW